MKEKRLVVAKESIFEKIKNFFHNLFIRKKSNTDEEEKVSHVESIQKEEINKFEQKIIVKEDKEKNRLLKLQDDFSKGYITEEEMSEDDVEKLHELYDEQIEAIEESTEQYKRKIIEIRKKLEQYNS